MSTDPTTLSTVAQFAQLGAGGLMLAVTLYVAHIFTKLYKDVREAEAKRTEAFVDALQTTIRDARSVVAALGGVATTLHATAAESRELLRDMKDFRRDLHRNE